VGGDDRWWREHGERGLRGLLLEWDPIGVSQEPGWPSDEYDAFIEPLADRLRGGASEEDLSAFLEDAVRDHLGLEPDPEREENLARSLKGWYSRSGRPEP
jgi:hypothetical protein